MPTVSPTISANFWADYAAQFKQMLLRRGVFVAGTETDDQIVLAYFNRLERNVSATPRVVHQPPGFSIPRQFQAHEAAIATVKQEIETGVDLTPRMSRKVQRWGYVDGMLADFGIQHLHLGTTRDADGFYAQGAALLYVRFDDANAYFLAVSGHGEWANVDLIEVIHTNWPASIDQFRLRGAFRSSNNFSAEERMKLRRNGMDSLITVKDGTVYLPPGGGFSTSGDSTTASMRVLANRRALNHHEAEMRERVAARLVAHPDVKSVRISLAMNDNEARAIEPISGLNEVLWT
ncbi:MAG: hypothetical protein M3N91_02165 [Pseudomonadota bacterium]|nr:hypothetical protein [Pseudomonadota bacterium]